MTTAHKATIALLLLLGLTGAIWSARNRVAVERGNRTVALCVDDLEVRQLAAVTGQKPEQLLAQLKQTGATHVGISEMTAGEMMQGGTIILHGRGGPWTFRDGAVRLPSKRLLPSMADAGVEYDSSAVASVRTSGLGIVARPMPDYLLTPAAVEESLTRARDIGAKTILFNGVSVAGGAQLAEQTADIMNRLGLQFGFVELVPQEGAANLASALKYQIIRTHSISQEEMTKTSPIRGLDRFTLGVTERNIRLCYIRLLLNPQPDIVAANIAYIRSIHDGLAKAGYQFGDPQPFQPLSVPQSALALMGLGVVGGALWLLMEVLRPRDCWFWWLLGLGAAGAVGTAMGAPGMAQALLPLKAAVIFPTLAVLFVASRAAGVINHATTEAPSCCPGTQRVLKAMALVIVAAAITALGGFLIAGMLSSSPYMTQIALFRGVKMAQLVPMLLVFVVMLARTYGQNLPSPSGRGVGGEGTEGWPMLRRGLVSAADAFIKYWHAVAVLLVLGLVAFMIMRSGNESAVEVSGLELKLRALLDQILVVRPRTKEILFGFPALLVGLTLLLSGRPRTVWIWLTFGIIGLISMTNTFCHLHTPLTVSLIRVGNGVWVGLLVGIVWLVAKVVLERILRIVWWTDQT